MAYEVRFYRDWIASDAVSGFHTFQVTVRETDLQIRARRNLARQAERLVEKVRREIETWGEAYPDFFESMLPLPIPANAHGVPLEMLRAGQAYDVGPMAAVAGAVAEAVGRGLLDYTPEVMVENGGDIFVALKRPAKLALFSGEGSPFSRKIILEVGGGDAPFGVCTSSGTVGHSTSYGAADAVVVVADSAAMADAAATALANEITEPDDIQRILDAEKSRGTLRGVLAVLGESLGAWGEIKLQRG